MLSLRFTPNEPCTGDDTKSGRRRPAAGGAGKDGGVHHSPPTRQVAAASRWYFSLPTCGVLDSLYIWPAVVLQSGELAQ
jgi:hypothetical protein